MSTFYCDYEGGNDSNAGTSFALRWKTLTNGATAARIAPGDTVRMMASPDQTSLAQSATWTDGPLAATFVPTSSTNATPIVFTKVGHSLVTGDTVIVASHTTNTNANGVWGVTVSGDTFTLLNADGSNSVGNGVGGATGTVRKFTNAVVKLATAITQNIAICGNRNVKPNWTASANVTDTVLTTDYKEGGECQKIDIAAGFTAGLAAYFPTGTLDLSGYQQVSFWIKQTAGTLGADSSCSLALCSDTAGTTVVNTINIPALGALNRWSPITVDLAGALGASIQSIAFIVNTDNGAQTFLLDNIIASKASSAADSLSNTSLIGKNTGTEGWYGIQSISGTRVVLDQDTNAKPTTTPPRGYSGTTETVTTWKLETTKTNMVSSGNVQTIQDSGTEGNLITFSGGWNRTDMSTQVGETIFDGQNGTGDGGILWVNQSYLDISQISVCRYGRGYYYTGSSANCRNIKLGIDNCNNNSVGIDGLSGAPFYDVTIKNCLNNSSNGALFPGYSSKITIINSNNNGGSGCSIGSRCIGNVTRSVNNASYGASLFHDSRLHIENSSGNGLASISYGYRGESYLVNSTLNSSPKITDIPSFANNFIWSTNENSNTDTHFGYTDGGLISSDITTVHTAGGMSWKLSPTSTNRSASYPLPLKVAIGATPANTPITCNVWFRRDNTGITARLICKGGQLTGVDEDVIATMTAAADVWEQLNVTVTPTQKGVLEFYAEVWGGTAWNAWCDDVSFS